VTEAADGSGPACARAGITAGYGEVSP